MCAVFSVFSDTFRREINRAWSTVKRRLKVLYWPLGNSKTVPTFIGRNCPCSYLHFPAWRNTCISLIFCLHNRLWEYYHTPVGREISVFTTHSFPLFHTFNDIFRWRIRECRYRSRSSWVRREVLHRRWKLGSCGKQHPDFLHSRSYFRKKNVHIVRIYLLKTVFLSVSIFYSHPKA